MIITANITANTMSPLSFPNIMGIGPIKTTPPVLISVFEDPEDDCRAVPMIINRKPIIITAKPIKIREL
jgi:hypothetical protein